MVFERCGDTEGAAFFSEVLLLFGGFEFADAPQGPSMERFEIIVRAERAP